MAGSVLDYLRTFWGSVLLVFGDPLARQSGEPSNWAAGLVILIILLGGASLIYVFLFLPGAPPYP
ncbi:MAG TPA: hypothetical protein VLU91_00935 [Nitrososphaerales archaeon]|nr:hypothetical protein [Nitrososphaerales archaeon]